MHNEAGHRGMRRWCVRGLLLLTLSLATLAVQATPIPFKKGTADFQASTTLAELLPEFFHNQGLEVVLSPLVKARAGTVNGHFRGSYAQIWTKLSRTNGLIGYWDGSAVYVYLGSERKTDFTSVSPSSEQPFLAAMHSVSWGDSQNVFHLEGSTGLVTAVGAPRFITQVKQMAATVSGLSRGGSTSFKLFPLKYAWAADTTMTVGNHQITIPGVASVLNALVGKPQAHSFAGASDRMVPARMQGLRGQGLASDGSGRLPPPLGDYSESGDGDADTPLVASQGASIQSIAGDNDARIVADSFRNAIIVRDSPERLPMYGALIRQLDVPPQMVEIEVAIIDVNKQKLRDLGIDWYFRNGSTTVGFAPDTSTKQQLLTALGANSTDLLDHLFGFQIGAVLGDPAHFVARINALQNNGITQLITRPQVVTMSDVPAVIEKSDTIYVPVSGAYNTDLYNIVAGTTLRVTPHVIDDSGVARIRMVVQIEDGNYTLQKKDVNKISYPIVHHNAVTTQAIIKAGQGLLLGGMVLDQLNTTVNKVPILGDIPLLGYLFKHEQKERDHVERLFLITPRLVNLNHITGQQTPSSLGVSVESQDQLDKQQDSREAWWHRKPKVKQPESIPARGAQPAPVEPSPDGEPSPPANAIPAATPPAPGHGTR